MSKMSFLIDIDVIFSSAIKDIKVNRKYMSPVFVDSFC